MSQQMSRQCSQEHTRLPRCVNTRQASASAGGATCAHNSRHKQQCGNPDARPRPHTHSERDTTFLQWEKWITALVDSGYRTYIYGLLCSWNHTPLHVCMGVVCIWCVCCSQLGGGGWAGGITISISADQREAPSNPGLSPGSNTLLLGLIVPSSLLAAEQQWAVCVDMVKVVWLWGIISQLCTWGWDSPL